MCIRLRPHHLLCTQGYQGKGYNDAFVSNMNRIVGKLRGEGPVEIQLTFSTDDLCVCCPHMLDVDLCDSNEHVKQLDGKVVEYFHLEEKTYNYMEITEEIRSKMTPEILADICGECSWYPVSACRERLVGKHFG